MFRSYHIAIPLAAALTLVSLTDVRAQQSLGSALAACTQQSVATLTCGPGSNPFRACAAGTPAEQPMSPGPGSFSFTCTNDPNNVGFNAPRLCAGGTPAEQSSLISSASPADIRQCQIATGTGSLNGGAAQSLQSLTVNFADSLAQGAVERLSVKRRLKKIERLLRRAKGKERRRLKAERRRLKKELAAPRAAAAWASARGAQHDGYSVSINPTFAGPGFEYDEVAFLANGGIDITQWAGLGDDRTWEIGAFAGYNELDLDIGSTPILSNAFGVSRIGHGENDSFVAGAYSLMTYSNFYSLSVISGNWGESDFQNNLLGSRGNYDTEGFATVSSIGGVFPLGDMLNFDARASYGYSELEGDRFVDSVGFVTGRSEVEEKWGGLSGTLFAEMPRDNGGVLKPFVKVGVKHRFDYDNKVFIPSQTVAGVTFNSFSARFDDDDTSINVESGLSYAVGKWEYKGSVSYDGSDDYDTVGGRIGVKINLN